MKNKKREDAGTEKAGPGAPPTSFEDSLAAVEGAVEQLERGNLTLEESLREYERGLVALKQCYELLERAQKRIEVLGEEVGLVAGEAAGVFWKPAASHPALGEAIEHVERDEDIPPDP